MISHGSAYIHVKERQRRKVGGEHTIRRRQRRK
jgi:hypothetical protein